MASTTS